MQDRYKTDFVNVVARIRPRLSDQHDEGCLQTSVDLAAITIPERQQNYFLDHVFNQDASQQAIYVNTVKQLVDKLMLGYNSTVFAYGQTGSGKTYTMGTDGNGLDNDDEQGIINRTIQDIMTRFDDDVQTTIRVSFYEIYNEKVYDLLNESDENTPLIVKGFQILSLTIKLLNHYSEGRDYLKHGAGKRHKGGTKQNPTSSRSHAVFTIYINSKNENSEINAMLNLVDLAGSECVRRTCTEGSRFQEGVNINIGLLSIGQVISALSKVGNNHIPYRESTITTVLKDSLNRNNYITLIACVSANILDLSDTIQTLEFAQRAKKMKNKPELNVIHEQNKSLKTPSNRIHSASGTRSISRPVFTFRTPLKRPPSFTTSTLINNNPYNRNRIANFLSTPTIHSINSTSVKNCQQSVVKTTVSTANVNIDRDAVPLCSTFIPHLNRDNSVNGLSCTSSVVSSQLETSVLSPMLKSYLETIHNDAMAKLDQAIQEKLDTLMDLNLTVAEIIKLKESLHNTAKANNQSSHQNDFIMPKENSVSNQSLTFVGNPSTSNILRTNKSNLLDIAESATETKEIKLLPRKRKLLTETLLIDEVELSAKCRRSVRLQAKDLKTLDNSIFEIADSKKSSIRSKKHENQNNMRRSARLSMKITINSSVKNKIETKSKNTPIPAPRLKVMSTLKNHNNCILDVLNHGSEKQLMELSTVGLKTAKQLYHYRSIKGKFKTISDLAGMPWKGRGYQRFLITNFLETDKI